MVEAVAVVGAGQAAQSLIETLRREGYAGRIALIGDEPTPPYQRPPLSKAYLLGEMARERLFFRPESFFAEQSVDARWGVRVEAIDRAAGRIALSTGEALAYDALALTTGARPRRLPGAIGGDLAGVHTLRTLADIDAIAPEVAPGRRVLIVGGGYIGLEAAAVAAKRGLSVTLLEAAPRVLARVAAPETARYFADLHRAHGVDLREGAALERFEGAAGRVGAAVLADGARLEIDFALVGVGVAPNVELAEAAGLAIEPAPVGGIAVDAQSRTSDPAIVAAGDAAAFPFRATRVRIESVQNAIDQGAHAARAILGADAAYAPQPWFWSDQYDVKLQIAGLNLGADRVIERPGETATQRSVWYFEGDALRAVDAMNEPRAFMQAKRWLAAGLSPDPARLADPATPLKALV